MCYAVSLVETESFAPGVLEMCQCVDSLRWSNAVVLSGPVISDSQEKGLYVDLSARALGLTGHSFYNLVTLQCF